MKSFKIKTSKRTELIDITSLVQEHVTAKKLTSGIALIYSPHTTAGITINENADPDVVRDINAFLNKSVPENFGFAHMEGNSDAHIKGSLINFSQSFIIEKGQIQLGRWQGIYFCEFDGPRNREFWIKLIPG